MSSAVGVTLKRGSGHAVESSSNTRLDRGAPQAPHNVSGRTPRAGDLPQGSPASPVSDNRGLGNRLELEETEKDPRSTEETEDRPCSQPKLVSRVVVVPLATPEKKDWQFLFDAARESARFGNHRLAERYLKSRGVKLEPSVFVEYNEKLSSVVRLGVDTNVQSSWARNGRKILAGTERLAQMDAFRALSFQVHQGGGSLVVTPSGGMSILAKVLPGNAPKTEIPIFMKAVLKNPYLKKTLDNIAAKEWPLKRISIKFFRGTRKIKAHLTYARPAVIVEPGSQTATVSLYEEGSKLVLRCQGRELHLTDQLHRLRSMKDHFAQIHTRLRMSLGKARRYHRMRQKLVQAGNFEQWAHGPLHMLSSKIITWAKEQDAGLLTWSIEGSEDLPWYILRNMCTYKGTEAGITIADPEKAKEKNHA
jgi:hypothetical protein